MRAVGSFAGRYGPWCVVTGASSGIGLAIAREAAARGLDLLLVARGAGALEAAAAEARGRYGVLARTVALDLGDRGAPAALERAAEGLDVGLVVCAAGFGTSGPFVEGDLDAEGAMIDVNCRAVMEVSWRFGRRLARRGRGGLVLLGSLVGFQGVPMAANYAATKA